MGYIGYKMMDDGRLWWKVVDYGEKWSIWSISVDFDENPGGDPWFWWIRSSVTVTRSLLLWGIEGMLLSIFLGYIQKGGGGGGGWNPGGGAVENSAPTHLETEKCPTSRC